MTNDMFNPSDLEMGWEIVKEVHEGTAPNRQWPLGNGWRVVYVKTRPKDWVKPPEDNSLPWDTE